MGVFNASESAPAVFKAGKAIVSFGGAEPALALDVTVQFTRQVENVPVLGNTRVLSIGEPTGTISCNTIVGSKDAFGDKITGDGCSPFSMTITMNDGACNEKGKTIKCMNCVASAVSITAQGGRGYIAQGVTITFTAMTM